MTVPDTTDESHCHNRYGVTWSWLGLISMLLTFHTTPWTPLLTFSRSCSADVSQTQQPTSMTTKRPFSTFVYAGLKTDTKTGFDLVIFFFLIKITGSRKWTDKESRIWNSGWFNLWRKIVWLVETLNTWTHFTSFWTLVYNSYDEGSG